MRADEYAHLDGLGLAALVRNKQVSARDLLDIATAAAVAASDRLNFLVGTTPSLAEFGVRHLPDDAPFLGVPTLVKDIGPKIAGVPQEMGSAFARGWVPTEDSEFIRRLKQGGFIFIGRSATPEFGSAFTTEPRIAEPTRNPWDPRRSPGGSSGGAAVAVAAGIVPVALAGDTAGSIRIPAHCCGIFGLKPTRGRNPTGPESGEVNCGMTAAHVLTRSVRDSAAVLDASWGADPGCRYAAPTPKSTFLEAAQRPRSGLRIAMSTKNCFGGVVSTEVLDATRNAARLCEALGHRVTEIDAPLQGADIIEAVEPILAANTYHLVRFLERRAMRSAGQDDLEASTLAFSRRGAQISADELLGGLERMNALSRTMGRVMTDFDVLLTPCFHDVAPLLGTIETDSPVTDTKAYLLENLRLAAFTIQYNISGQPAMSVPLYQTTSGLPIGVQFGAGFGAEETLFALAGQLEQALPWNTRHPVAGVYA